MSVNMESDINDFTPSLLNPRSEKLDILTQITQKSRLSLKKEYHIAFTQHARSKRERTKEEIRNIADLPNIDENLNLVNTSENHLMSRNMEQNITASQIVYRNPQNISICKKCQFPASTSSHEDKCKGPIATAPICEKGSRCYTGNPNHYLKKKHTALIARNSENSLKCLTSPDEKVFQSLEKHSDDGNSIFDLLTQKYVNNITDSPVDLENNEDIFNIPTQIAMPKVVVIPNAQSVVNNDIQNGDTTARTIPAKYNNREPQELCPIYQEPHSEYSEHINNSVTPIMTPEGKIILRLKKDTATKEWKTLKNKTNSRRKVSLNNNKNTSKAHAKRSLENDLNEASPKRLKSTKNNKDVIDSNNSKLVSDKEFYLHRWISLSDFTQNVMDKSVPKAKKEAAPSNIECNPEKQGCLNNESSCDVYAETVILGESKNTKEDLEEGSNDFENSFPIFEQLLPKDIVKTVDTSKTQTKPGIAASSKNHIPAKANNVIKTKSRSFRTNSDYYSMSEAEECHKSVVDSTLPCHDGKDVGNLKLIIDGTSGIMAFNAEMDEKGWKFVTVEGSKNLVISKNNLKQCKCNKHMEAHLTVKDSKCKGKSIQQSDAEPLEEKLKICVNSSKEKTEKVALKNIVEVDSDVEIVDWDVNCKPNMERIVNDAKACGLDLDFTMFSFSDEESNNNKNR